MLSSLILLSSMQPVEWYNSYLEEAKPCVVTGQVINIEFSEEVNYPCSSSRNMGFYILNTKNEAYKINSSLYQNSTNCMGAPVSLFYKYNPSPKVGDNINFLVNGSSYHIIANEKNDDGTYKIPFSEGVIDGDGKIHGDFPLCKNNLASEDIALAEKKQKIYSYLVEVNKTKPKSLKGLKKSLNEIDTNLFTGETKELIIYMINFLDVLVKD